MVVYSTLKERYKATTISQTLQEAHQISLVDVALWAVVQHVFDKHGMRLVAHLEDILAVNVSESLDGGLQIVQPLPHVSLWGEDNGLQPFISVADSLQLADFNDLLEHLSISQFSVADHGAATLNGFNNFVTGVASQCKTSCFAVKLHCSPESLLGTFRHTVEIVCIYFFPRIFIHFESPVCFIKDNDFLLSCGQSNFLLGEHFNFVSDYIYASFIGGIQFQYSLLAVWALNICNEVRYKKKVG